MNGLAADMVNLKAGSKNSGSYRQLQKMAQNTKSVFFAVILPVSCLFGCFLKPDLLLSHDITWEMIYNVIGSSLSA